MVALSRARALPEAPDLEVIREFLDREVRGTRIEGARVLRPTVLRTLDGDFASDVQGRTLDGIQRRGKFLLLELSADRWMAINPMLTGALQYTDPSQRLRKSVCLVLTLEGGKELRYLDERQMGKVYYLSSDQMHSVPRLHEQGPDVLSGIPFEEFQQRLKPFHGEIKGVLTRGSFMSGIGNAYSDEILFAAGISPFRKARSLKMGDLRRLYDCSRAVVLDAIDVLRERMGDDIHVKVRDFLKVHNKGGQPCPGCGSNISQLTANQRITSYCRRCQPGMLIKN